MKILLVWTHPNEKSLCSSIAQTLEKEFIQQGHEVHTLDLYRIGFDPVLNLDGSFGPKDYGVGHKNPLDREKIVYEHYHLINWADGLVFVYPIWWWDRPALLKGWFDRIFIWKHAIDITPNKSVGLLKGKRALIVQTCGSSEKSLEEQGAIPIIQGIIADGTLKLCEVKVDKVHSFYEASRLNLAQYEKIIEKTREIASLWK